MQDWSYDAEGVHDAQSLVLRAISAEHARSEPARHKLPDLGEVGAAIARASRLAAADHRARLPRLALAATQAAGLLEPDAAERAALFADLERANEPDDGLLLRPSAARGFVWRLHPAPAEAGAALARAGGAGR